MTAPLTHTRVSTVTLRPIDPEDQSEAEIALLYPRGAVVRLLVDGVVLVPCIEDDGARRIPAVMVRVAADCPEAGQIRVWRVAQITDSPIPEADATALRSAALARPTEPAVLSLLTDWGLAPS